MKQSNYACWAPFSVAVKMILAGLELLPISPKERASLLNLVALAENYDAGNMVSMPHLTHVRGLQRVVDVDTGEVEVVYFIPDVARVMVFLVDQKNLKIPAVVLDYLNNFGGDGSEGIQDDKLPAAIESARPEDLDVLWQLFEEKDRVEEKLREAQNSEHNADPSKMEAKDRLEEKWSRQLKKVNKKIERFDGEYVRGIAAEAAASRPTVTEWKPWARAKAKELKKIKPRLNNEQISRQVFMLMQEQNITGRGGKIPSVATIARHALQNLSSKRPR